MHKSAARYCEVEDEVREFVAGLKVYVTEDLATYYTLTCPGTGVVHTAKDEKLCVMDSIERVLYVARATVEKGEYAEVATAITAQFDPSCGDPMFANVVDAVTEAEASGPVAARKLLQTLAKVPVDLAVPDDKLWRLPLSEQRAQLDKWGSESDGEEADESGASEVAMGGKVMFMPPVCSVWRITDVIQGHTKMTLRPWLV